MLTSVVRHNDSYSSVQLHRGIGRVPVTSRALSASTFWLINLDPVIISDLPLPLRTLRTHEDGYANLLDHLPRIQIPLISRD